MRFLCISQTCPEIDDPRPAPAGVSPAVREPVFERFSCRGSQLRRAGNGNLLARVQREKMRDMPVAGLGFLKFLIPFHQSAIRVDLRAGQVAPGGFDLFYKLIVDSEYLRRLNAIGEQIVDDLLIHGRAHRQVRVFTIRCAETIFGRYRWAGDELARFRIFDEKIEEEFGRLFHNRKGLLLQKFSVAPECVMFPEMLAAPGRAAGPHPVPYISDRTGPEPCIRRVMGDEAAAVINVFCGLSAARPQVVSQVEERFVTFGQVADLCGPVVHLDVDIDVVIAVPRRFDVLVPDTLEVCRHAAGTRTGHQKITAELKVQGAQGRIVGATLHGLQPLIGRFVHSSGLTEIQRHPAEQSPVLGKVCPL